VDKLLSAKYGAGEIQVRNKPQRISPVVWFLQENLIAAAHEFDDPPVQPYPQFAAIQSGILTDDLPHEDLGLTAQVIGHIGSVNQSAVATQF
jgi:hypothetical protein